MDTLDDGENFETFRDCLSVSIIAKLSSSNTQKAKKRSGRRRKSVRQDDPIHSTIDEHEERENVSELSEFVDVGCLRAT